MKTKTDIGADYFCLSFYLFPDGFICSVVVLAGVAPDHFSGAGWLLVVPGGGVDVLRVADGQVPLEREHGVQEDGAETTTRKTV